MKTTLLIIALVGFTAIGGYAQDKSCTCKKKVAIHKATHHRAYTAYHSAIHRTDGGIIAILPEDNTITPADNTIVVANGGPRCYRKDDMTPQVCPDVQVATTNTYLGYYPEMGSDVESVAPYKDLVVTSTAFTNYGVIPVKYTCEGEHASPPLNISDIPEGTKSLAVVMYDPRASATRGATYWLIWNVDTAGFIPENFVNDDESLNAAKEYGYQAVCPASGTHYYHFMVYALDTKLVAGKKTNKATLERVMNGHILAKGELIGVYNRHLD